MRIEDVGVPPPRSLGGGVGGSRDEIGDSGILQFLAPGLLGPVHHRRYAAGMVEAESVALMIGAAHGMNTTGYTIPYVSTWAARVDGKEPVEVVKAVGERVRKTALGILDQLDTSQLADGTPPGLERTSPAREAGRQISRSAAPRAAATPLTPPQQVGVSAGVSVAGRGL